MYKECPICGRPFSVLDVVLLESDVGFQCHNCWNRVHATGPVHRGGPEGTKRVAAATSAHRADRPRRKK
jgi:hypothetical protein